jgi:hypothetical protein
MRFVKNFQNNTTYIKDKELITYPEKHNNEDMLNILSPALTTYDFKTQIYVANFFDVSSQITRKGMTLKIEIVDENGSKFIDNPSFNEFWAPTSFTSRGWTTQSLSLNPILIATEIGSYDRILGFGFEVPKKIRINYYERGFSIPSKYKIVTMLR